MSKWRMKVGKMIAGIPTKRKAKQSTRANPPRRSAPRRIPPHLLQNTSTKYDMFGAHAADLAREEGVRASRESGDVAARRDRQLVLALSRRLYDDNLIFKAIIRRIVTNLMGPAGFPLQARTKNDDGSLNEERNTFIEQIVWKPFTDDPEVRGLYKWGSLQKVVAADMFVAGDEGFVKTNEDMLQMIESERIGGGKGKHLVDGIRLNPQGRPVEYNVLRSQPDGRRVSTTSKPIAAEDFIYVHGEFRRITRTRPFPPFMQAFSTCFRLEDVFDSEAISWQILARQALIVNKENSDDQPDDEWEEDPDHEDGDMTDRFSEWRQALIFWGNPGEKVSAAERNIPGKDFQKNVKTFLSMISMLTGLPIEVLMMDWTGVNFSGGKASQGQMLLDIRSWQATLIEQFHMLVYNWRIQDALDAGILEDHWSIFDHEWFPPAVPWMDPVKEGEGWGIRVDRGLVTYDAALREQGKDLKEENKRREQTIRAAITIADGIEKDHPGRKVGWEIFAGRESGKTADAEREKKKADQDKKKTDDDEPQNPTRDDD